ncbi:AAA family ATPase [Ornithobacterium rhinotracheale]
MTNLQKNELQQVIKQEIAHLGSAARVAKKAKVSDATISHMINNNNWNLVSDGMWLKVAQNLGYSFSGWALVETLNYKTIANVLTDAKDASLFMGISYRAGSGKTATLKLFSEQNKNNNVFYIQAREWSRREFLTELCRILGQKMGKGYQSVDKLSAMVVKFFKNRIGNKPLLIVDEADKLKPNALRFFIFLFNELEDEMGVVISGTENLQQSFERGAKFNKLGFDELSSRFGRKFIKLIGATYKDVKMICEANGLSDEAKIKEVFAECEPTLINRGGQDFKVVEDLRRLKRVVKRELIIQKRG